MRFLVPYLSQYKKLLALSLLLAAINQLFSLMDPQVFRRMIDTYLTNFEQRNYSDYLQGILWGLWWLVGVAMVSRIAKNFQDYFVNVMTNKIGMQIYQQTIEHTFSLPYAVFEDQQSGNLLNKLKAAKDSLQLFITSLINVVFFSLVGVVFVIWYSFRVDWRIGLVYCLLLPVVWFTTASLSRKIKTAQDEISKQTASVSWSITESIRNVSLIKMLWLVGQEIARLDVSNKKILWLELSKVKKVRSIEFIQGTLINAMRVFLIGFLAWLVYKQEITVWELMSLYFYSFFIFGQLSQFGMVVKNYQEAKANHELLQEIRDMKRETVSDTNTMITNFSSIAATAISFAYSSWKEVLTDVSFTIQAGETIAFVWPSGSGKSTILKLLAWLYTPREGSFLINWIDIQDINLTAYKQKLGIVSQDAQLFSGSIAENLRFVAPDADDAALLYALKQAALDDFVLWLEAWIATLIGEGGVKLSGWQKQRLAIARALLRDPSLLVFDEATSALDSLVEKEITETIQAVSTKNKNLMTVLVAHRLSTVMHADRIYVLEQGQIIEQGSHEVLLKQWWLYAALWREQVWE